MQRSITSDNRRWWALVLLAAAQFMVIMDTSIIGVALPDMQADLGFSQDNLSWVFNAYVIAFGGLLLLGGRLSDLLGPRRVFAAGWVVLDRRLRCSPAWPTRTSVEITGSRDPGRRLGVDRAVRADAADDALRRRAARARQGAWPSTAPPHPPAAPPACSSAACSPSGPTGRGSSSSTSRSASPSCSPARACCPQTAGRRGSIDLTGALAVTGGLSAHGARHRPGARGRLDLARDARLARRRRGRCSPPSSSSSACARAR